MKRHVDTYTITELSRALGLRRGGYYEYLENREGSRAREDVQLQEEIQALHRESRGSYGRPRLRKALAARGYRCGNDRVAKLMKQLQIQGKSPRKYRVCTTDLAHSYRVAPNRLAQVKDLKGPDQVWASDITYIKTQTGWAYLALVMDLYSLRIVGWSLRDHLHTGLTQEALERAVRSRRLSRGLIHHSDRGVQYASDQYQRLLRRHQMSPSMSRKGNCYDNATMESFMGSLKAELDMPESYSTIEKARKEIFNYIEIFYNRKRLHSSLGYQSPVDFEASRN